MKGMRRKMYGFKCTAIRVYRPASLSTGPKEMLDNEPRPDIESFDWKKVVRVCRNSWKLCSYEEG